MQMIPRVEIATEYPQLYETISQRDYTGAVALLQESCNDLMQSARYLDVLGLIEALLKMLPDDSGTGELLLWCNLGVGNAQFHLENYVAAQNAYLKMRADSNSVNDFYLESVAVERLGELATKQRRLDEAEQFFKEAAEIKLKVHNYHGIVETFLYLAGVQEDAGKLTEADDTTKRAGKLLETYWSNGILQEIPEEYQAQYVEKRRYLQMAIYFQSASLKRSAGNIPSAIRISRNALKVARSTGDRRAEAKLLQNIANDLEVQGKTTSALREYDAAIKVASDSGSMETLLDLQICKAVTLLKHDRFAESIPYYESARVAALKSGNVHQYASLTVDFGMLCIEDDQLDRGIELLNEVLQFSKENDDAELQKGVLRTLLIAASKKDDEEMLRSHLFELLNMIPQSDFAARSILYQEVGDLYLDNLEDAKGASLYFRQSAQEAIADGDRDKAGYIAAITAARLFEAGSYTEALNLFDRSAELFRELKDEISLLRTRNDRANLLTVIGSFEEAIEEQKWCLQKAIDLSDRVFEARSLYNLGETMYRNGDVGRAIEYVTQAIERYQSASDQQGESEALNNMSLYLLKAKTPSGEDRIEEAQPYIERALRIARQLKNRGQEAMALRNMGVVSEKREDYANALRLYKKSADLWESVQDYVHCAEALSSRLSLQAIRADTKRFEFDLYRLMSIAVPHGASGVAARGIVTAAGRLVEAGKFEPAANLAFLSLYLNQNQDDFALPTEDDEFIEDRLQADMYDINVYIIDLVEIHMSDEEQEKFIARMFSEDNFSDDEYDIRKAMQANFKTIREELKATDRYKPGGKDT